MKTNNSSRGHGWIIVVIGILIAATLLFHLFPRFRVLTGSVTLIIIYHVIEATVVFGCVRAFLKQHSTRRLVSKSDTDKLDFGWSKSIVIGLQIAPVIIGAVALGLQLEVPHLWPLALILGVTAVNAFIGSMVVRASNKPDWVILPLVDLFNSENDRVLDAGCGGGRTTIAVAPLVKNGRVVALDRFDSGYIDGGGRTLIEKNLRISGLTDNVTVQSGDITSLPFAESEFDSAVSTHVIDHLGSKKATGLKEIFRVLKPGGRFLMTLYVPGWLMFTIANVLSFHLTPKSAWRKMVAATGFNIRSEGMINGAWFILLEKPV